MARPRKRLTKDQVAQVEALGAVLSQEQIAEYFGIAKGTWYAILKRQPEVLERYEKGKARAVGSVAQGLLKRAIAGDNVAAIFYLKTQARWTEKHEVEHSGKVETTDARAALMAKLAAGTAGE